MTARRCWFVACCVSGTAVLALVITATGERRVPCRITLIPAYVPPAEFAQLARGAPGRRVPIVNPANGPGAERDARFARAIAEVQRAGTRVLGYVPTGWGARPAADVEADLERYAAWYRVDGFFLDEASAAARDLAYYRELAAVAARRGSRLLVLNPGVFPDRGYFALADVVVTFEGSYDEFRAKTDAQPQASGSSRVPGERAHLIYGATRSQALDALARSRGARYVYVTAEGPPNPWGVLPSYLPEVEATLVTSRASAPGPAPGPCAST